MSEHQQSPVVNEFNKDALKEDLSQQMETMSGAMKELQPESRSARCCSGNIRAPAVRSSCLLQLFTPAVCSLQLFTPAVLLVVSVAQYLTLTEIDSLHKFVLFLL